MQYQSTGGHNAAVSASEAIVRGLAPDGGLYVPQEFPRADLEAWRGLDYPQLAAEVLALYLTDYDPAFLQDAAQNTYTAPFAGKAGRSSHFAGPVECCKGDAPGRRGHIAIGTNSVERAIYHLSRRGVTFEEATRRRDGSGRTVSIYLQGDFGGFAIHLVQT